MAELSDATSRLSENLRELKYAASPWLICSVCSDVCSDAGKCASLLALLDQQEDELWTLASFYGDINSLSRSTILSYAAGDETSAEKVEKLLSMADNCASLSENISRYHADSLAGETIDGYGNFAELDYKSDSNDKTQSEYAFLSGQLPVTEDKALEAASYYSGIRKSRLTVDGTRNVPVPVYLISSGDSTYVEVTQRGGYVLRYVNSTPVEKSLLSSQDAVKRAEKFIGDAGFNNMIAYSHVPGDNRETVSFAYNQKGILCYPDTINVTVALDTGGICGFDMYEFAENHVDRSSIQPRIDEKTALNGLSPLLSVENVTHCVIESDAGQEILCYEFECTSDGENVTVYVNAESGIEEKIELG